MTAPARSEALERFMASTSIDYDAWHDGVGYDLDALRALGTPAARAAVVEQLRGGRLELRLWAARALGDDRELAADREAAIVSGLAEGIFYGGLSVALDLATELRTPAMIQALFRASLRDDGEAAVQAAARLAFIHRKAKEEFDWELRP